MKTISKQPISSGRISHPALGSTNQFVEREYAREVISTLERKENLIIEAPVGADRQAAYLIPTIEHAVAHNKRVLVVCATRDLISELNNQILPEIQGALPCSFSFMEVGTREDYLCRARLAREINEGTLSIVADYSDIYIHDSVVAWTQRTLSGDRSELPHQVPSRIWKRISCPSSQCPGECSSFREECYAETAYRQMNQVDVIICDYTFLYKTLRENLFGLPTGKNQPLYGIDIAVLEEPMWAASLGREHSGYTIDVDTFRFATRLLPEIGEHSLWAKIVGEYDFFFRHLHTVRCSNQYSGSLTRPNMFPVASVIQVLRQVRKTMSDCRYRFFSQPNRDCTLAAELDQAIRACEYLEWKLDDIRTLRHTNHEITIEDDFRGFPYLHARPRDVSRYTEPLFEHLDSVIVPSVTIHASTIQQLKKVLGADPCRMVIVEPQDTDNTTPSLKPATSFNPKTLSQNGAQQ